MHVLILGFITALMLTYMAIPAIIRVARERKLYDQPNERSSHVAPTPSLGGIGIFGGAICGIILWTPHHSFALLQYTLAAFVIVFLIGVHDDLLPVSPTKKVVAQLLAAIILAYKSEVRITGLYGILGVQDIPEMTGFALSVLALIGITNAFNLTDGINGLAGSLALLTCALFGAWFAAAAYYEWAVVAFSLAGSLIAFLRYNVTPAKIFMGDTGSLFVGLACAVMAIKFVEINKALPNDSSAFFPAAPALALGILILPIYDTLRVFIRRMLQGKSPFHPDKTHIHHMLLEVGCSHMQATAILVGVNLALAALAAALNRSLGISTLSALILLVAGALNIMLYYWVVQVRSQRAASGV